MASRRTAVLVYRWSKVHCHRLRSVWTLPVVTTNRWVGVRRVGEVTKTRVCSGRFINSLNWRKNRSKNKLVCEHAVAWLGKRELLLSGKLRLVKLFWFLHQSPKCTKSMYLLPFHLFRGPPISFSRDQNLIFLSAYLKCCIKKVWRLHCRCIYQNVCPDCKHGESVTIVGLESSRSNMAAIQRKHEGIPEMRYY